MENSFFCELLETELLAWKMTLEGLLSDQKRIVSARDKDLVEADTLVNFQNLIDEFEERMEKLQEECPQECIQLESFRNPVGPHLENVYYGETNSDEIWIIESRKGV